MMPEPKIILVLAVVAAAMFLFVWGRLRVDVVALCTLAALLLLRLIHYDQAMYGFASKATATVAAMFVLSEGLIRTGWVQWLVRHLGKLAGKKEGRLLLVLCGSIALLSAFIINTATVAIFIPVSIALAEERKISASRVLMPISFASQFGGVCTLIGTSTNILVSSIAVSYGMEAFGMFEFAPLGLAMTAAGILYLVTVTPHLIPKRKGTARQIDKYRLADYLTELQVMEKSPLEGNTWNEALGASKRRAKDSADPSLLKIIRDDKAVARAGRTKIRSGDILLLHGDAKTLMESQAAYGLKMLADVAMTDQQLKSHKVKLVEALIPPNSSLVNRTYKSAHLRRRFGCVVLAIQRRRKILRDRLEDIDLEGGDSLLLQGDDADVARVLGSDELIVTNELTDLYVRKDRALLAVGILAGVVVAASTNLVPILSAAIIGAILMVLGNCLTIEEAYKSIDWKVIFLLGGIIPLGLALEQTGAATWLAQTVLSPFVGKGPIVVLALFYLLTAMLTETMSNNASAVLLAPIAFSMASAMEADPRPFLIAITFAASTSFATPVGYKTNTMIYAPGGYRFLDYTLVGGPLNIVFWIIAVVLIPVLWPF